MDLWNKEVERIFFQEEIDDSGAPERLFNVTEDGRYLAYWPKSYLGPRSTLQSRNAPIGRYTETWTKELLQKCVQDENLFAVKGVICNELGLSAQSRADVVIAKQDSTQLAPEDILMIFEVKMSVVWNWELRNDQLRLLGDYRTHRGQPGLIRSDSVLKAIGKVSAIRALSDKASTIPIIVITNTPIAPSYLSKVDYLKTSGIVQGFWSINPKPLDGEDTEKATTKKGFMTFDSYESLKHSLVELLSMKLNFFSSMRSKEELGQFIGIANKEPTYEQKAETLLKLLES